MLQQCETSGHSILFYALLILNYSFDKVNGSVKQLGELVHWNAILVICFNKSL